MKHLNYFICILMTGLIMAGCSSEKETKVGISIGPANKRWLKDRDFLTEQLESKQAKVFLREAKGNLNTQFDQIRELIEEDIDVLIVVPVSSNKCGNIIQYAKKNNVKVIAYDRIIKNCDLDYYISFDNVKVGELQAEYLTRIKPEGDYLILGGSPADNNSMLIKLGQMNILQPLITRGDINIVMDEFIEGWSAEKSFEVVDKFLENGSSPDAILAANDAIANGAANALNQHGMAGEVLLSGQDATADACKRIIAGTQTMTVYKVIESLAYSTVNIAMDLAGDHDLPNTQTTTNNGYEMVPAILLTSVMPVTSENIRMTVIADGYLDESEIFNNQ